MELDEDASIMVHEPPRAAVFTGSLNDNLGCQKAFKALETARKRQRRELFDAQDAIDAQRDGLIGGIERELHQRHEWKPLFDCRWHGDSIP